MDKILLFSNKVWIAENTSNGNMVAKFCICDFDVNRNGVQLNRDTIENWMQSMVNQPLVGKIKKSAFGEEADFTGHNMKRVMVKDEDGNYTTSVEFDTDALGVFTSVDIETIDDKECIVGTAEIWSRYPRAVKLIRDRIEAGTLSTSWEISVNSARSENGVKIVDDGVFTALAMLGKSVLPAYESSRLLEVAEEDVDDELISAIEQDFKEISMDEPKKIIVDEEPSEIEETTETEEPVTNTEEPVEEQEDNGSGEPEEEPADEPEEETSALTQWDLFDRITRACREKLGSGWGYIAYWFPANDVVWYRDEEHASSELDYVFFVYTVNDDDTVSVDDGIPVKLSVSVAEVNDALAAKDDAIAQAATEISSLKQKLAELEPFVEAYEQAEAERKQAEANAKMDELRQYALRSGLISEADLETEEIQHMIAELDEAGIKQVIASRYMASLSEKPAPEVKETPVVTASLTEEEVKPVYTNAVLAYLAR